MTNAVTSAQVDLTKLAVKFGSMVQAVNTADSPDDPQLNATFGDVVTQIGEFTKDTASVMSALSEIKDALNQVQPGLGDVSGDGGNSTSTSTGNDDSIDSTDLSNSSGDGNSDDDSNPLPF